MNPRLFHRLAVLLITLFVFQGCTSSTGLIATNAIDPMGGLTREDYLALRERGRDTTVDNTPALPVPPIPKLPYAEPIAPFNPALEKLVSVTATENVPVRDLILELVRKAEANVQIDPRVQGRVIISAHEQPFESILKRICALANLRYTTDGSFIHIEPDDPYQKSYRLDYLSLSRQASSATSISTNVFDVDIASNTSSSKRSGGSAENNSVAKVSSLSTADFWDEAEKSIAQMLGADNKKGKANYSINKQAGMITIFANQKVHNSVASFIDQLRQKSSAQVLIDARIIEVELNEEFQSGIDWNAAFKKSFAASGSFGINPKLGTNGFFTAGITGTNFGGLLNLVQTFGATRVLSAPRITVLNNQTAIMKVATNQVYFVTEAKFTTTTNASGASITTNPVYTSTPKTVPVGLIMTVQPSIDMASDRITMTLRPTISRIVGEVSDPSIGLNAAVSGVTAAVKSQIPVLAVREMDSVIQLQSGEIAVMGGLMQDSSINSDKGIPGLADMSWIGNLFKSRDNQARTTELVILLRATISGQATPDAADGNLYHTYNKDPRPIKIPPAKSSDVTEEKEEPENDTQHERSAIND